MNLGDRLGNPRKYVIRKWLLEILGDRYAKHDTVVERVAHSIVTDRDMEEFTKLVADLYEVGYLKCMNEYRDKFASMGVGVSVTPDVKRS